MKKKETAADNSTEKAKPAKTPKKNAAIEAPEPMIPAELVLPEPLSQAPSSMMNDMVSITLPTARSKKVTGTLLAVAIAVILFFGLAFTFHWWGLGLNAQQRQEREAAALVSRVGTLILLPPHQTPVVAMVTDAAALKASQSFYQNAQNGDILLVYKQAARAILYRPSQNIIINVGSISVSTSTSAH